MKVRYQTLFIAPAAIFISCQSDKKEWQPIAPGYAYWYKGDAGSSIDSFTLFMGSTLKNEDTSRPLSFFENLYYNLIFSTDTMKSWIKKLEKGISGQIKVTPDLIVNEMLNQVGIDMVLFLKIKYKPLDFAKDSNWVKGNDFCKGLHFISSEEALENWNKTNDDFTDFLDENILPAALEIKIPAQFYSRKSFDSISALIKANTTTVSEISYPTALFKTLATPSKETVIFNFKN